jgi:hypothetical protein
VGKDDQKVRVRYGREICSMPRILDFSQNAITLLHNFEKIEYYNSL